MKTIRTTLKLVFLTIAILTFASCKKDKKEDQPQPAPVDKYYIVEYKAEITGQNIVGEITYWDFNLGASSKEFVSGNNPIFTKTFAVKNGGYASLMIDADAFAGSGIAAKGEIWVDGVKKYNDFNASSGNSIFVIVSGTID